MQKLKPLLLTATLLLCSLAASAHDFEVGDIYYNITSATNKTVAVTYRGSDYMTNSDRYTGAVTVPSTVTYNGVVYSVTSIGDKAFYECRSLTSINIPASVTSIGNEAFGGCSSLTAITIPEGVTNIGGYVFCGCNLSCIRIPASVKSIGEAAFANCGEVEEIIVASGNVNYDSRDNCNAIIETSSGELVAGCVSTIIPEGVTSIGYGAFAGLEGLSSIAIPESVTSIGAQAFSWCKGLTSITFSEKSRLISIGSWAFQGCISLTSITIPESVTSIGSGILLSCSSLTTITCKAITPPFANISTFDNVDKSIPVYVPAGSVAAYKSAQYWNEFTNIQAIPTNDIASGTCGDNLTWRLTEEGELIIEGTGAMYDYSYDNSPWYEYRESIQTVMIKEGATSVGDYAFYACANLTSINIPVPESVTSIGDYAFSGCENLTAITIPESVTSIGYSAFAYCSSLTAITIPTSVTSIGGGAFYRCTSLTAITLPESVTSIGDYAFRYCFSLTAITIPEGVTSIAYAAFNGCSSLTAITIPEGVTSIGLTAFGDCSSLTAITCEAKTPPTHEGPYVFSGVNKSIPVYVPASSVEAYKSAQYWSEFTNIQAIVNNVVILDSQASFTQGEDEVCASISYTRNFKNTNWQALYVPFEIPVTVAFLTDFEVADINDIRQYDHDNDGVRDDAVIEAFKVKNGTLKANYPYLIRVKEVGEKSIVVTDATLYAAEENSIDCSSVHEKYTFTGTYCRMSSAELPQSGGYYALSGGIWQPVAEGASLGAFRFYLNVEDRHANTAVTNARSIRVRVVDENGEEDDVTEISNSQLMMDDSKLIIYDLQGRRITDTANLKGVYIVNGKKVVY